MRPDRNSVGSDRTPAEQRGGVALRHVAEVVRKVGVTVIKVSVRETTISALTTGDIEMKQVLLSAAASGTVALTGEALRWVARRVRRR